MRKNIVLLFVTTAILFSACKGEKGDDGQQGPQGNANVGYYSFTLNRGAFHHYTSSHIWGEPAPSSIPLINGDQAALVYTWLDPVDGSFEWVQQPYTHYFASGNTFNEFSHGIDAGRLWVYMRNSAGNQPYASMSGTQSYKLFILQSRLLQQMQEDNVDLEHMEQVDAYFVRRGITVEAR